MDASVWLCHSISRYEQFGSQGIYVILCEDTANAFLTTEACCEFF
jgi:hypothetical protein